MAITGSGDLLHRLDGGVMRRHALLDVVFHRLHHHDGIVHHQPDGQHQSKKRKGIDGEPQHGEDHEGPNQRDRNGEQRDERGPPTLEEDVDHENDQDQSFAQGFVDFVDAGADRERGVERNNVVQPLRETCPSRPPSS